ncbi:MAG: hypothetical protein EPO46_01650 [Lysobacter sp.]|nr:MAG: hypothetical protein EPO46_01650 [Lysobacter sp.]
MGRFLSRLPLLLSALLVLLLAGCATGGQSGDALQQAQYDWSAAIRWGDFEGAANLVDPDVRAKHASTAVELERYKQVQISSYRDLGSSSDAKAGTARRDIEIGVINRHTLAERIVRYRETWRWDAGARRWWVTSGLPDLWAGQ